MFRFRQLGRFSAAVLRRLLSQKILEFKASVGDSAPVFSLRPYVRKRAVTAKAPTPPRP
jgi:hypothetical protein